MEYLILGTGGHALEIGELAELLGCSRFRLIERDEEDGILNSSSPENLNLILGMGDPIFRLAALQRLTGFSKNLISLIHPETYISKTAQIKAGTVIQYGSVISSEVRIASGVLVNWNSTVGHHASIGTGTVINPGASVSGYCKIGEGVLIGTGARILEGISVGNEAVVGAGAVVTKDIPNFGRYVGIPAKEMQ
jgi:sugar O-acyltransferase (sialic acid O-acetyltransferase NeuD family)